MAPSKSSDDPSSPSEPPADRPRLVRPARPATAPGGRSPGDPPAPALAPRLPRPFVPRGAVPAAPRPDAAVGSATAAAPDAPRTVEEPTSALDPVVGGSAGAEAWAVGPDADSPHGRAAIEALAGELTAGAMPVVPGADAALASAPPSVPPPAQSALRGVEPELGTDDAADSERAAEAEWQTMRELGSATPPAVSAVDDVRTGRSEPGRLHHEIAIAVVPPAEAWPEDVWSEDAAAEAALATASPENADVLHPVSFGNDVAPAPDDDPTLGAQSSEPLATAYPPGVPDTLEAYALDGATADQAAPSAVYTPDHAQEWATSAGGVAADGGMPVPAAAADVERTAGQPGADDLPARLHALAGQLQARSIEVAGFDPAMRDSEALVALLAVLLRQGR